MPKSDQGVNRDRYQVIPRTLIFVIRGQEVLLLKGASTKRLWADQYNGIGGHIERGEDAVSAARRELLEETGLSAKNLSLCGTLLVDASPSVGIGIFIYRAEYSVGMIKESPEGSLEWLDADHLDGLSLVEDLTRILPRVLAWQPGDSPFSARSFYDAQEHLQVVFSED